MVFILHIIRDYSGNGLWVVRRSKAQGDFGRDEIYPEVPV